MPLNKIDRNIMIALERVSRIFRILLWGLSVKEKLSPIQIHILLYLDAASLRFCRVSQLAKEFGLSKATISSAVKTLVHKELVVREICERDKRASVLQLASNGKALAKRLFSWNNTVNAQLKQFPSGDKEPVLLLLMKLLSSMRETGIIDAGKMCLDCAHFQENSYPAADKPYRCNLTGKEASISELNFDCKDYMPNNAVRRRVYA